MEQTLNITLIAANIVTVITGLYAGIKLVWFMSKLDSRVSDAKSASIRAHKRIDDMEKYLRVGANGVRD